MNTDTKKKVIYHTPAEFAAEAEYLLAVADACAMPYHIIRSVTSLAKKARAWERDYVKFLERQHNAVALSTENTRNTLGWFQDAANGEGGQA